MSLKTLLTGEKKDYDITGVDYRLMFEGSHGTKVLTHLLYEMHFCEEVESPEEVARRNVLVRMLHHAGILTEENLKLLADKLLEVGRLSNKKEEIKKENKHGSL